MGGGSRGPTLVGTWLALSLVLGVAAGCTAPHPGAATSAQALDGCASTGTPQLTHDRDVWGWGPTIDFTATGLVCGETYTLVNASLCNHPENATWTGTLQAGLDGTGTITYDQWAVYHSKGRFCLYQGAATPETLVAFVDIPSVTYLSKTEGTWPTETPLYPGYVAVSNVFGFKRSLFAQRYSLGVGNEPPPDYDNLPVAGDALTREYKYLNFYDFGTYYNRPMVVIAHDVEDDWLIARRVAQKPGSGLTVQDVYAEWTPLQLGDDWTGEVTGTEIIWPRAKFTVTAPTFATVIRASGDLHYRLKIARGSEEDGFTTPVANEGQPIGALYDREGIYLFFPPGTYGISLARDGSSFDTGTFTIWLREMGASPQYPTQDPPRLFGGTYPRSDQTNSSPILSLPPIVTVPAGRAAYQFQMPAIDPDGDALTIRLSNQYDEGSAQGFSKPSYFSHPPGLSVNATGLVTFDTQGKLVGARYLTGVVADEYSTAYSWVQGPKGDNSYTVIDPPKIGQSKLNFTFKIVADVGTEPTCALNPPQSSYLVSPGETISFTLTGEDVDPDAVVKLNSSGPPPGATVSPALPLKGPSGTSATFTWTPDASLAGRAFATTFFVSDENQLQAFCPVTFLVRGVGPRLTLPGVAPQSTEATGPDGGPVTYPAVTAVDVDGNPVEATCTPPSGGMAPLGESNVTCSATDAAGNTATRLFKVTVVDTTPPDLTVPADIDAVSTDGSAIPVTFEASATDLVSGAITPVCSPSAGSLFSPGETTVTCAATDGSGNVASKSFKVTVFLAPVVTVPADMKVAPTDGTSAVVTFSASATDSIDGPLPVTCTPPSGATFPGGDTTVTCTATNSIGIQGSASFNIYVKDATPPVISVTLDPAPNSYNWYNSSPVTRSFSATDPESGIRWYGAECATATYTDEGSYLAHCVVSNNDGYLGELYNWVRIDLTAPQISGAPSPAPNDAGWNNTAVSVEYTCTDARSGIPSSGCPEASVITTEGLDQSASGTATDRAGNTAGTTVTGINIDLTAPLVSVVSHNPAPNDAGWNNTDVVLGYACEDALSGVLSCGDPETITGTGTIAATGTGTDNAGNVGSASYAVKIDRAPPNVTPSISPDANGFGWRNTPVTVSYTCVDYLSGMATCPDDQVISTEGTDQSVTVSATDVAGNSRSTTVSGIDIDLTGPTVTPQLNSEPNEAGWHTGSVVITYSCADDLSGVYTCPNNQYFSSDGIHTATASGTDRAGNSTTSTVSDIKIDNTPPNVFALRPQSTHFPYYDSDVTVTFQCNDNLSGVASCPDPVTVTTEGINQAVTGTGTDNAGNSKTTTTYVHVDKTAPSLTATYAPQPNAAGWNKSNLKISFTCTDNFWVETCPSQITVSEETDGLVLGTVSATDYVGHLTTLTLPDAKLDKTPPTLTSERTPANGAGWNNGDVTVTFTCGDTLSGIATCPPTTTLSSEGDNQSVSGTATDVADNSTSVTVGPIKIDKTAPGISATRTPAGASGWNTSDVVVDFQCSDALSGIVSCTPQTTLSTEGTDLSVTGTAVDAAGNTKSVVVGPINLDKTPPEFTGTRTPAANAAGWNNTDVTVSFTCTDAISGVASCPETQTVTAEGYHTGVGGTASDVAGNSISALVYSVYIDKTPPTIAAAPPTGANSAGWFRFPVIVSFLCSDALSGIASCPSLTLSSDGANQSAEGTATDQAGNTATDTVSGINIDQTPPTIVETTTPPPNEHGWNNTDVTTTFECADALSGVASCNGPYVRAYEGPWSPLTGSAIDLAGNTATVDVAGVKIDKTAPTISVSRTPVANAYGWNNGDVQVAFACNDSLSGVLSCPAASAVSAEGAGQSVTGTVEDYAGNTATATVANINIDKTAPSISATRTPAGTGGWNTSDVVVSFQCSDSLSGLAACTPTVTVGTEGANQTVTGTALDKAGNAQATSVGSINVDKTQPTITVSRTPPANALGWNNTDVTVSFSCADAVSGIASCTGGGSFASEGVHGTVTGTATDHAGLTATATSAAVQIDKTPPTIDGSVPPPEPSGWYTSPVTATFTCADALSGIQQCTETVTLSTQGTDLSVSGSAVDAAGNSSSASVGGIKLDSTAPEIEATFVSPTEFSEWFLNYGWLNVDLIADFTCTDNLSGVVSCPPRVHLTEGANQTVTLVSTDVAGNETRETASGLNIDKTPPTIVASRSPEPNAAGWNNTDVSVSFTCTDALAGIHTCTPGATFGEGANQSISGTAIDFAGNSSGVTVAGINVDKQPPSIDFALVDPSVITDWYLQYFWLNTEVQLDFFCNDSLSGVASCPPRLTIGEGYDQSFDLTATDVADNAFTTTLYGGINVDLTPPTIVANLPQPNENGWYNTDVTVTFTCDDALSGILSCPEPITLTQEGIDLSASGTAQDYASNMTSTTASGIKIDKTAPMLECPVQIEAPGGCSGATVPLALLAEDGLDLAPGITCQDQNGENVTVTGGFFPLGTTTVTCVATDAAGNSSNSCTFNVSVYTTYEAEIVSPLVSPPDVNAFRVGQVIPVKARVYSCEGGEPVTEGIRARVEVELHTADAGGTGTVNYVEGYAGIGEDDGFMRVKDDYFHYNLKTGEGGIWPEDTLGTSTSYVLKVVVVDEVTGHDVAQTSAILEAH